MAANASESISVFFRRMPTSFQVVPIFPYTSPAPEEGKKRNRETITHPEKHDIKCMVTYCKTPQCVPLLKNEYEQPAGCRYNFRVWGIFKF